MEQVAQLEVTEDVWIHPDSVKVLQKNLGFNGSQDMIERAVFELSERLETLRLALDTGDIFLVHKIAKSLVGISEQLGLVLFSRISRDVAVCADRNDLVAVVAVTRRLMQISDASLYAAIGAPDPRP